MTAIKTRRSAFKRDSDQNATVGVQNFERPFTPRGWLRSASNFAKTRFRRFPTFHFSMSKTSFDIIFSRHCGVGGKFFFMICSFWESWSTLSLIGVFSMQNDPDLPKVQVSTFLGGGVEGRWKFFFSDFGPKLTFSFCSKP